MNQIAYYCDKSNNTVAEIECLSELYKEHDGYYIDEEFVIRKIYEVKKDSYDKIYIDKELDYIVVEDSVLQYINLIPIRLYKDTIYSDGYSYVMPLFKSKNQAIEKIFK